MAEENVNVGIEQAFEQLKAQLANGKCRVVSEQPPAEISAVQGSIWGTTAKTAQKKMTFSLRQGAEGTRISSTSALARSYLALTLVGVVFSLTLLTVCAWIALDLQAYTFTGVGGAWGWLAQTQGFFDAYKAELFARLGWILSVFLAASLAVEGVILCRVKAKLNLFADEIAEAALKRASS